jgi:hypothetical protein
MPKRTITQLHTEFEKARAALDALPQWERSDTDEKRYEAVLAVCTKLSERIVKTRAHSIEEMLLKIRAGGWRAGTTEPPDRWTDCADGNISDCLVSIRKDLQAMQSGSPRRASRQHTEARTRHGGAFELTAP